MSMKLKEKIGKFSKNPGCVRKIPLNPPLQKGEAVGIPGLIEMLPFVLNLEHLDFDIVSDFGFRYSHFHDVCSIFVSMSNCQN
jgi:hypothetical protein